MDDIDHSLLRFLEENARMSVSALAHRTGVARSTVQSRIARMEQNGTITGYTVKLANPTHAHHIATVVLLTIDPNHQAEAMSRLKHFPELYRLCTLSGRFDLLIELKSESTEQLDALLDRIGKITGVRSSESLILLSRKRG